MDLKPSAALQIQKPIELVFEGIVNPEIMTKYFISESSGWLESGKEVVWKFPEFAERFPVTQVKIEKNRSISFVWDPETVVNIILEKVDSNNTIVRASEGSKVVNENNIKWAINNTAGWSNFLSCLKAYLEYGVQLRLGAYDFMKK